MLHHHLLSPSPPAPLRHGPELRRASRRSAASLAGFRRLRPLAPDLPPARVSSDSGIRFRHKLLYLESLNVDPSKALDKNPDFRSAPLDSLKSVERCLYSFGIDRSDVGRIFGIVPQLLTADAASAVVPVFRFLLDEVGIPFPSLRKSVNRCPRLLVCSVPDQLRPTFNFLRDLGFVGYHRINCQTSLLLVSSVEETLVPKLEYLQSLGFSYKDTVKMVLRSPPLLTLSIEKNFAPKVEYFVKEMKGDLKELKEFPQYFSFSLERKIKPRHRVLVEYGLSMPLPEMLKVSDLEFDDRLMELRVRSVDDNYHSNLL